MKKKFLILQALLMLAAGVNATEPADSVTLSPDEPIVSEFSTAKAIEAAMPDDKVILGNDTVSMILPERNLGRYHRGLFNFLFIPKGQWAFGLTASYGEFNTDDVQILSLVKNIDFKGKLYSIKPTVSYFFKSNQSLGLRFNYTRGNADLANLSMDFDEDLNFSLQDVSYSSQSYGIGFFYRSYIGLSSMKRFAIFNEVEASVSSGSSRFIRMYNGEPRDTRTMRTACSLNFSPGVTMFIMDYVSFNISFGVFGVHFNHEKQTTDGKDDGSRTTSGANFKFNLFNINFGIGVHI